MPVFLGLALMNLIVVPDATMAKTGALVFLVARTLYVAIYIAGVPVVRTLLWAVSWAGLVMMLVPLLDRI